MSDVALHEEPLPFSREYRAAGVLLHIASLPSQYGIGDVGPAALAWVDRLHEAGQSWWQALPLGPTGYGNSPYQALSSFAGNELLISPDGLIEEGLLRPMDLGSASFPGTAIDYDAVIAFKKSLLETVCVNFAAGARPDLRPRYDEFCHDQSHWLDDYALFRALKAKYKGVYYIEWPAELVARTPSALSSARSALSDQIEQTRIAQFLLRRQGERLREHARAKRVRLIGDLPFFVSPDSSDVWVNPELFLLDEQHRPRFVAGVPPDYFSSLGQLWGNPVYDWDAARRTGYRWCIDRLRALLTHVDMVRLDHFRAFAAAWHVRAAAATAQIGDWVPGPGADFFAAAEKEIGSLPFIAEDLGLITPDVGALRDRLRLPGTRVLQFAFDGHSDNPHRPDNFMPNTVVYTGTHDNPTTRGWFDALPAPQKQELGGYLGRQLDGGDAASALIELAWSSVAALAIAPLQDFLNLGNDARMNLPGRADGNWRWRFTEDMLTPETLSRLLELTQRSARMPSQSRGVTERHVT